MAPSTRKRRYTSKNNKKKKTTTTTTTKKKERKIKMMTITMKLHKHQLNHHLHVQKHLGVQQKNVKEQIRQILLYKI